MTRILSDGFEMGDLVGFSFVHPETAITTDKIRSGNYSLRLDESEWAEYSIKELSEFYFRCAIYTTQRLDNGCEFRFKHNGLSIVSLRGETLYIGDVSTEETIPPIFLTNEWQIVELYVKIHEINGQVIVKINGEDKLTYNGNTDPQGTGIINELRLYMRNVDEYYQKSYYDDLGINDTTGDENNSWLGDGHIIRLTPNAVGDNSDFLGSDDDQIDNYLLVDEIPADDLTYVLAENVDDYDLYQFENCILPEKQVITTVWAETTAKDPGVGEIAMLLKSGATLSEDSLATRLIYNYTRIKSDYYSLDPDTGLPWTEEKLNAIQAGLKVKS